MAIFDDIELEWNGVSYTLSGDDQIMKVLAAVEDHITIAELSRGQQDGRVPLAKLSGAYHVMLRSAGCHAVKPADVYNGMWKGGFNQQKVQEAILSLLAIMVPPDAVGKQEARQEGKPSGGKKKKASSKRRGKPGS